MQLYPSLPVQSSSHRRDSAENTMSTDMNAASCDGADGKLGIAKNRAW